MGGKKRWIIVSPMRWVRCFMVIKAVVIDSLDEVFLCHLADSTQPF